jgi:hypothetical protein
MKTTVMFTVLPRGRVGNQVRLSLFVTPKIRDAGNGTILSATPLKNWPAIIKNASYRVVFGREEDFSIATLDPNAPEANARFDTTLWSKFFPGTTPVQNFPTKHYDKVSLTSFATTTVHDDITSLYQSAASQLTNPSVGPGGSPALTQRVTEVASSVSSTRTVGAKLLPPSSGISLSQDELATGTPKAEYMRVALFYNHDQWRDKIGVERPDAPKNDHLNDPEFHSVLGALGDHPALLRRLGLIIDLTATIPPTANASAGVRVIVTLPAGALGAGDALVSPRTLYKLTPSDFSATVYHEGASADEMARWPLTENGMLPLDGGAYLVTHLDVDHAATEFIEFSLNTQNNKASSDTVPVKLPALRTAGFGIYRENREADYPLRINRPYTYDQAPDALNFTADELVRGYRFDVSTLEDNGNFGPWKSLCERVTAATPSDGSAALAITDEGAVKASALTASDRDQSMLQVHESLCRWNGWSLVAERPGRTPPDGTGKPEFIDSSGASNVGLKVKAKPGSLTRLRLGKTYRFRARVTDLAGNDLAHSPSAAPSSTDNASTAITFKRYEPVVPPTLLLRSALTEGESLEHVVIRSNPYGKTSQNASDYAKACNAMPKLVGALAGPMNTYAATSERHVAPPKTSYYMAEIHGAFDGILSSNLSPEQKVKTTWAIATKEEGSFYDSKVTDTSVYPAVQHDSGCMRVTPSGVVGTPSDVSPMPERFDREPLLPGQYVIYPQDAVRTPYLPDANAPGFAIHGDALPNGTFNQAFSGAWPEVKPMRVVLTEGDSTKIQAVGGNSNAVTLTLPPGARTSLTYSSTVASASVMELAQQQLSQAILKGQQPVLSPAREITFVHAVQQPKWPVLRGPDLLVSDRGPGETTALVQGPFSVDGPSTNHVDVVATWQEVIDGFFDSDQDPRDNPTNFKTVLCSANVDYNTIQGQIPPGTQHAFGDTKRRDVSYKVTATTRFREYFAPSITIDVANVTNDSGPVKRIIRSTARPPVPKVLYSVPNFSWSQTRTGNIVSQRKGGVRVYVDRGWFASGADERLAVVLQPKGTSVTRPETVSVWGNDPTRFAASDLSMIDEDAFVFGPGERDDFTVMTNVESAEGSAKVTVVTFKPKFHKERKVWYFDIGLDPKASYFPFVRLAVARFQPYSLNDLRLSRTVQTEFVQVSAPRTATLSQQGASFAISVDGVGGPNVDFASGLQINTLTGEWQRGASGHVVKAEFQESILDRADELDFKTMGSVQTLVPYAAAGASAANPVVTFKGSVSIPANANPNAKHRVVIREYERYQTDAQDGVAKGTAVVKDGGAAVPYAERVVYVDSISVTI